MNPIKIKGVDLKFNSSSEICSIEEKTSGEIQTALIQNLTETSFFKGVGIKELTHIGPKRLTYHISLPDKDFPSS